MHILLGILGTVVTILILLNRLAEAGIDLGGLNPFLRRRRRAWQKKLEGNPVYHIDSPMEATALLMVAAVKMDGDLSTEEKKSILSSFHNEFHLSKRDAAGLFNSSAFLLGDGEAVRDNLEKVLEPNIGNFSGEQAESALEMLERLCQIGQSGNELKREFVERVRRIFNSRFEPQGKWQ
jgi:hypothetical protein